MSFTSVYVIGCVCWFPCLLLIVCWFSFSCLKRAVLYWQSPYGIFSRRFRSLPSPLSFSLTHTIADLCDQALPRVHELVLQTLFQMHSSFVIVLRYLCSHVFFFSLSCTLCSSPTLCYITTMRIVHEHGFPRCPTERASFASYSHETLLLAPPRCGPLFPLAFCIVSSVTLPLS